MIKHSKTLVIAANVAAGAGSVLGLMPPTRIVVPGELRGAYGVERSFAEAASFFKSTYEKKTDGRERKANG